MAAKSKTETPAVEAAPDKQREALDKIANYQWGHDGRPNALTRIIEDIQAIAKAGLKN